MVYVQQLKIAAGKCPQLPVIPSASEMSAPNMCGIGISAVKSQVRLPSDSFVCDNANSAAQAGLVVKTVERNGPAGQSGIVLPGDIIVSCNGTPCRSFTPLQLKPLVVGPAGTEVVLELERA
jgi:C-terminal processing protease CtpA/Prc